MRTSISGKSRETRSEFDSAISFYKSCLTVDPAYGPALFNLGLAYADIGKNAEAINTLREAARVSPKDAKVLFSLGKVLAADGKTEEGAKLIADALKIDPTLQPTG